MNRVKLIANLLLAANLAAILGLLYWIGASGLLLDNALMLPATTRILMTMREFPFLIVDALVLAGVTVTAGLIIRRPKLRIIVQAVILLIVGGVAVIRGCNVASDNYRPKGERLVTRQELQLEIDNASKQANDKAGWTGFFYMGSTKEHHIFVNMVRNKCGPLLKIDRQAVTLDHEFRFGRTPQGWEYVAPGKRLEALDKPAH